MNLNLIRFLSAFSFITLLLLFSQSLPTSAGGDGGGKGVVLLTQQPAAKAGEKAVADEHVGDDPTPYLKEKLRIYVRKVRGGGIPTRARGKTSSSAVRTQLSASVLGCSLFLFSVILL